MIFENVHAQVTLIKQKNPLILNITNDVTMDFIANGLLSLGASPVMSQASEDVEDLIPLANAVVINLGTLDEKFMQLCEVAAALANQHNKPLILDPVGAGATRYRTASSMKLIHEHRIAIIRGNASEIVALSGDTGMTKGVDSMADSEAVMQNAKFISQQFSSTVVMSGKKDVIVKNDEIKIWERGSDWMPRVTGSGCLLSAIVAAFHAVENNPFKASVAASLFYSVCGEMAAAKASGPGSFKTEFLDALHAMPEEIWYENN